MQNMSMPQAITVHLIFTCIQKYLSMHIVLKKLVSWQERVLKEENTCFDSVPEWCFSKKLLFQFSILPRLTSQDCLYVAYVPGAREKPGTDQALRLQAFYFIPLFLSCKRSLMVLPL